MLEKEVIRLKGYDMKGVISRAKKDFGSIARGTEGFYNPQLDYFEQNIYIIFCDIPISDNELKEVIEMIIYDLKGIIENKIYDYNELIEAKQIKFSEKLQLIFNPFLNNNIKVNDDGLKDLKGLFTLPIMCLLRIYDSIDFWNKRYGKNGYYKMLEEMVLPIIQVGKYPYALEERYLD